MVFEFSQDDGNRGASIIVVMIGEFVSTPFDTLFVCLTSEGFLNRKGNRFATNINRIGKKRELCCWFFFFFYFGCLATVVVVVAIRQRRHLFFGDCLLLLVWRLKK
jgi:hypothetical protein